MNTVELAEIYDYLKNELTPRTKGFIEKIQKEYSKEIERLNKENKELDKICARKSRYIDKKDLEIGRLNNIISELEKWLDKKEKLTFNSWNKGIHEVQRKLQELKGADKE